MPEIEVLKIEDYDEVLTLWRSDMGIRLSPSDDRENIARYLRRNPNMSFVARHNNEIVGTILGGHDGFRGYFYHLYVAPHFRGQGIARRLVEVCRDAVQREGIAEFRVFVLKENVSGRDFWRKLQWQEREWVQIYGWPTDNATE